MKKITLTAVMLFLLAGSAFAAKLTMVAVVDLTKIVSDYFQESAAWREIDQLIEKTEETLREKKEEINRLEQRKMTAIEENNQRLSLQLDEEIRKQQDYMKEYNRIMTERIESKKNRLMTSSDFSREIIGAVEYVAETEGFSIVLRKKDPNILYYNFEVDITDKVLEYLRK
ncbi:MAG: OmpH family outer membrane protein [Sediminispirochaetaceae bacterium]